MGAWVLWLHGQDLQSKYGFGDGDMPDVVWEALEDEHGIELARAVDWHVVLQSLVREYLLPLVTPPIEVHDVDTNHKSDPHRRPARPQRR
ncbi:hypothetical protein [Jiangella alkaliphila]|uniref:Uncharacterized protein n=1 Tax=Jiangella alkaliphila TaxID=419479 RepID=A0A1H2IE17_9ACTN|nr:hypothetical protein [Jiangella alkaliphila]SDU42420.1 hypothetical protein SAMN04488563_1647 [Jiangella alkaliphila]